MHVLIPTDFSDNARNAIDYCRSLFVDRPLVMHLLHVASPQITPSEEQQQSNLLDVLVSDLKKDNAEKHFVTGHLAKGDLIKTILQHIDLHRIELLVMGTKGIGAAYQTVIGSNTLNVIHKVPFTTLVVPEHASCKGLKQLVFPTDLSTYYSYSFFNDAEKMIRYFKTALKVIYLDKREHKLTPEQSEYSEYIKTFFSSLPFSYDKIIHQNLSEGVQSYLTKFPADAFLMAAKNIHFLSELFLSPQTTEAHYLKQYPIFVVHG